MPQWRKGVPAPFLRCILEVKNVGTVQRYILDARRWLCLFMVCCIILCGIGGIHQRAQALVGVDDALIAVVIAGLAAVGITFVSTGAYSSLSDYVGSLLGEYADSRGLTPAGLFTGVQSGANSLGQLIINNRFVQLIETFGTWIQGKFSLVDNSSHSAVMPGVTIAGMVAEELPVVQAFTSGNAAYYYKVSGDSPVYGIKYSTRSDKSEVGYFLVSRSSFTARRTSYDTNGNVILDSTRSSTAPHNYWKEEYGFITNPINITYWTKDEIYLYSDITTALRLDQPAVTSGVGVDINTGTIEYPTENSNYADGDGAVLDVGANWGSRYRDIVDVYIPGLWTAGKSGDISIGYESDEAIADQVQSGEGTQYVSQEATDYQTPGLKDVFPFCLPFDVYNFLNCLAADPVAPAFNWRFYIPRLCDEEITVDLSPFDTVAQIVRTMELLAFCIGLAYVTRERFIRG